MKSLKAIPTLLTIGFVFLMLCIYWILNFNNILCLSPTGIHFTRQTDSLSFVYQYYWKHHLLFQPHVFSQDSKEGMAACEFPLLYYIVAKLYTVFGEREIVFRCLNLFIFTSSITILQTAIRPTGKIISYLIPIGITSSTILLYYSCNFLPEIAAFSISLIAIAIIIIIKSIGYRPLYGWLIMVLLTFSTLTKITYGIYGISIAILITYLFWTNQISRKKFTNYLVLITIHLIIVFAWYLYASLYNKISGDSYFLLKARPIWETPRDTWTSSISFITTYWNSAFYHPALRYFFALSMIWNLFHYYKTNKSIFIFIISLKLGCLSILVLFSLHFVDHDYYFVCFIPTIAINLYLFFHSIRGHKYYYRSAILVFFVGILSSLIYADNKLDLRYFKNMESQQLISSKLLNGARILDSLGISKDSQILLLGDETKNGGLYTLRRNGTSIESKRQSSYDDLALNLSKTNDFAILIDSAYQNVINRNSDKFKLFGRINNQIIYKIEK